MALILSPYSVEKNPSVYDDYQFTLPELYREVAKEELREDDVTRERSLAEMRHWIANNAHIRKCRTDAKFLLRFLRLRQFSVPMACEALERYLSVRELYPSWFKNLDCNDPTMNEISNFAPFTYLGQDSAGRTVMLIRVGRFNDHSPKPVGRYLALMMETVLEWEEMQVGGLQMVLDYQGCTVENFEQWGMSDLRIMADAVSRSYPLRYNGIHAFGLRKFALPAVETLLSFSNSKMREKINCHSSISELEKQFEPTMKPKEYGGTVDLVELNRAFRKRVEEQREITLGLDQMEIDVEHYASIWASEEGTSVEGAAEAVFKQLNVI